MQHKKQAFKLIEEIVHQNQAVWNNPRGQLNVGLQYDMLREELEEFKDASDMVDLADAAFDLWYVVIGTLNQIGFTPSQMVDGLQIVQDANAQKSGEKDANGKIIKPEGFVPPEVKLQAIIDRF